MPCPCQAKYAAAAAIATAGMKSRPAEVVLAIDEVRSHLRTARSMACTGGHVCEHLLAQHFGRAIEASKPWPPINRTLRGAWRRHNRRGEPIDFQSIVRVVLANRRTLEKAQNGLTTDTAVPTETTSPSPQPGLPEA